MKLIDMISNAGDRVYAAYAADDAGGARASEIQESGEMYLETIHILSKEKSAVRAVDICEYMGYSKPSVSRAVGILKNGGYIEIDKGGHITLTELGRRRAEKTYERHRVLTAVFVRLGVPEDIAAEDACKIEHVISDETFDAVKKYIGCGECGICDPNRKAGEGA